MKTVRVKVTEEHIKKGVPLKPWACPLSLAFQDAGIDHVGITPYYYSRRIPVHIGWGIVVKQKVCYKMPPLIQNWVSSFDMGKEVLPIEFEANVDPNYIYDKEIN